MANAVVYLRVSTGKQAEKDLPIQSQLQQCQEKAKSLGAEVVKIFSDEGVSGRTDARPQFQEALAYCETFPVDYFITWSTSRFARNRLDAQLNKRRLSRAEVKLEYVTVSIDSQSGSGMLHEGILELFDEYFSHQLSTDTRRSMIKNAKDGFWNGGSTPFGYVPKPAEENPRRKRLQVLHKEATIVRKIFELRLNGLGGRSIAVLLNDNGQLNRNRKWNKTSVLGLLRNECVLGMTVLGKRNAQRGNLALSDVIRIKSHGAIITQETWDAVQSVMDSEVASPDNGSPKSSWLFTGLIRCDKCGDAMQIESAKGRSKRYYYYNCRNYQRSKSCQNRRLSAPAMDGWLADVVCKKVLSPKNLSQVVRDISEMSKSWKSEVTEKRNELTREISRLRSANDKLYSYLESPDGVLVVSDLAPRIRSNNKQLEGLDSELSMLEKSGIPARVDDIETAELSELLTDLVKNGQNPRKIRLFFRGFIEDIRIDDDSIMINYAKQLLVSGSNTVVPRGAGAGYHIQVLLL